MMRDQIDSAGLLAGKVGTYGGASSALFFGLSAGEFAAIVGAAVGVLGYLTQIYFNRRRDKREQADRVDRQVEFEARMKQYRQQGSGDAA